MHPRTLLSGLILVVAGTASLNADPPQYETPEGAFLACREAIKKRDWETFFTLHHPAKRVQEARSQLLMVCLKAFLRPGDHAAQEILHRFQLNTEHARQVAIAAAVLGDNTEAELEQAMQELIDDAGSELLALLGASFAYTLAQAGDNGVRYLKDMEASDIRDLKIEGNAATAVLFYPYHGGEFSRPIRFSCVDGSWVVVEGASPKFSVGKK